jgi:hypothetical protein
MSYLFSMLLVLLVGAVILMAGILMDREPGQSLRDAFKDSVAWGAGFFIFFSVEFWMLGN